MLTPILMFALAPATGATIPAVDVPVVYRASRIIAEPRTAGGEHTLHLLVDTGGAGGSGMYVLTDSAVKRLHLAASKQKLGGYSGMLAALPKFEPGAGIPPPAGKYTSAIVLPAKNFSGPGEMRYDGILGAGYLPGNPARPDRIWTFDYPGQRLIMQGSKWHAAMGARATPVHFPLNAKDQPTDGFARIVIHIDGKPLSLLLDTGATGFPTPAAVAAEGGTATVRATSFITTSQLERWHNAHPTWRVIEDADRMRLDGQAMRAIEVPSVEIAGWRTGPVWFTERPDRNFLVSMSSMMDSQVEGALGGNAFRHFVMTVDYGDGETWFRCIRGCKASAAAMRAH